VSLPAAARNEQAKLSATYLNNVAVALLALGFLTPILSTAFAAGPASTLRLDVLGVRTVASGALHVMARLILRRIVP
jgi:hypothetical protein